MIFKTRGSMTCTVPELRRSQRRGQVLYGERQKKKKRNSAAFPFNALAIAQKVEGREKKKQQVKRKGDTREGKGGKEKTVWGEVALKKGG